MQRELAKALAASYVREKLLLLGAEPVGGTPNERYAMRRMEIEKWTGVIKRAGIKLDIGLMAPRIAFSNAMLGI